MKRGRVEYRPVERLIINREEKRENHPKALDGGRVVLPGKPSPAPKGAGKAVNVAK